MKSEDDLWSFYTWICPYWTSNFRVIFKYNNIKVNIWQICLSLIPCPCINIWPVDVTLVCKDDSVSRTPPIPINTPPALSDVKVTRLPCLGLSLFDHLMTTRCVSMNMYCTTSPVWLNYWGFNTWPKWNQDIFSSYISHNFLTIIW